MLNLTSNAKAHTCDGVSRRDFIQVGSLGAVGLSLPQMVEAQEAGKPGNINKPSTTRIDV